MPVPFPRPIRTNAPARATLGARWPARPVGGAVATALTPTRTAWPPTRTACSGRPCSSGSWSGRCFTPCSLRRHRAHGPRRSSVRSTRRSGGEAHHLHPPTTVSLSPTTRLQAGLSRDVRPTQVLGSLRLLGNSARVTLKRPVPPRRPGPLYRHQGCMQYADVRSAAKLTQPVASRFPRLCVLVLTSGLFRAASRRGTSKAEGRDGNEVRYGGWSGRWCPRSRRRRRRQGARRVCAPGRDGGAGPVPNSSVRHAVLRDWGPHGLYDRTTPRAVHGGHQYRDELGAVRRPPEHHLSHVQPSSLHLARPLQERHPRREKGALRCPRCCPAVPPLLCSATAASHLRETPTPGHA